MFSFDTNVLAYAADRRADERREQAKDLIRKSQAGDAWLTQQSLVEFVRFAADKRREPLTEIAVIVARWRAAFPVMPTPPAAIERSIELLQLHKLSVWDAHMLAVCDANGCEALLSEDMTDGAVYGSVQVLNPFSPHNAHAVARLLTT